MRHVPLTLLAAAGLTSLAAAQSTTLPFPLHPDGVDRSVGGLVQRPDLATVDALAELDDVTLVGMTLPSGRVVDLDLYRIQHEKQRYGYFVDGAPRPDLMDGADLSLWRGSVVGSDATDVMLSFSNHGCRGWLHLGPTLVHLIARPDEQGGWSAGDVLVVTEANLNRAGMFAPGECSAAPPTMPPVPSQLLGGSSGAGSPSGSRTLDSCSLRECPIAMETDWQYYQLFNDVNAATTYATTLLSFVSNRYEVQTSTVLTFPYLQIYTTSNDPWTSQDTGGNSVDLLYEFQAAWQGNVPMGATLGHFMSGAGLGGGVAWLDVLCSNSNNFAVSGNIGGDVNFPVVQQSGNWDFMVVAHEIGHNFDAPHTHDFCPPLDECAPSSYFGQCQNQQTCTTMGTIMSYCHLCSGGTANITTWFHPENAQRMTAASERCNDAIFEVQVDVPDFLSNDSTTQTSLQVVSGPVTGPVSAHVQFDGTGGFTTIPMVDQGGGFYTADLPAAQCGRTAEIYFSYDVTGLGSFTCPTGAPDDTFEANVGTVVAVFADDFEADLGWTPANLGATTGDWERGVPVDDAGWAYDPASDYDGSGSCYLTQNQTGNTDVDNGAVSLTSPVLDLSAPDTVVSYAYFLRLTNSDGDDRLLVEASNGGPWVEVTRHDTDGGLSWRTNSFTYDDVVAAGLVPTASTQLRFTANDADQQSIVEAGLDAFTVSTISCDGVGATYCDPAVPNSTGVPSSLSGSGSNLIANNDLELTTVDLPPNSFAFYLASTTQAFVANPGGSQGNLCLGGDIGRGVGGGVFDSGPMGVVTVQVDVNAMPQPNGPVVVQPGETWNLQLWHRDSSGGSATSNLSNGLSVLFQ